MRKGLSAHINKTVAITLLLSFILFVPQPHELSAESSSINEIELPEVKSAELKNKLKLFYIKDEIPQLTILLSVGFGKLYETNKNAGISDLLAGTLSLSGSKKYPGELMQEKIESVGGTISVTSSWEETQISVRVLADYADLAFDIISDLILNPLLDPGNMEKARSLLLEDVRRKNDSPDVLAFEKLREIIFNGDGYGAAMRAETLNSIALNDLNSIINIYFTASNITAGISSSIEFSKINEYFNKYMASIKTGTAVDYTVAPDKMIKSAKEKAVIYLLPKDIAQATIAVGTIAPPVSDNRIYELTLMDYILGGSSFDSRLVEEIRVKRGLSYAVQSVIKFRKKTGVFIAFAQTKNDTADLALSLILDNIRLISAEPVAAEELKNSKEFIRNSYIFEFDTPQSILSKYLFLNYNNLQKSFLLDYVKKIEAVSPEMLLEAGKDLFNSGLVAVVVGKKELDKKLEKIGKVLVVNP